MKRLILISLLISAIFSYPLSTFAKSSRSKLTPIKDSVKELKKEMQEQKKTLMQQFKDKIQSIRQSVAKIIGGEVASRSGTTLSISKDGKTYIVNTDSNTHFQRHFWGESSLSEFSVGNKVNVHGKFIDDTKTTILAHLIRNLSIMKRQGVFMGEVTAKNSDNFVIKAKNRDNQTVYFTTSTKFVNRNGQTISYSDLKTGHQVRVGGLWDKSLNKITEVVGVKDFSLSPQLTKTS